MKRALLLIVVPALLIALGFAQTPPATSNTDQTNIKGCLGGSDGNYTVVEDKTGNTFKITTSSVDLKAHLGHDVTLMGHRASGASPAAAENGFAVTELNMISEHCAAAAVAPAATVSALPETGVTPAVAPTPPAETAVTPAAPAVIVGTPAVITAVEPTPPAEPVAAPVAMVSTPAETAVIPAVPAMHPTRLPAPPQRRPTPPAAATTKPAVTASTPSEPVTTPAADAPIPVATATTSSEPASTPAAVATPPVAPANRGNLWLLIAFGVLVIVLGTMAPSISRWRKRRLVEATGPENLSFNREASSPDQRKSDPGAGKAA